MRSYMNALIKTAGIREQRFTCRYKNSHHPFVIETDKNVSQCYSRKYICNFTIAAGNGRLVSLPTDRFRTLYKALVSNVNACYDYDNFMGHKELLSFSVYSFVLSQYFAYFTICSDSIQEEMTSKMPDVILEVVCDRQFYTLYTSNTGKHSKQVRYYRVDVDIDGIHRRLLQCLDVYRNCVRVSSLLTVLRVLL